VEPKSAELLRRWGWVALFVAGSLVTLWIQAADFTLRDFPGRALSWATADGYSIGARTGLYGRSLVLFAAAFVAALYALRALERWLAAGTRELLTGLSLAGTSLLVAHVFMIDTWTALNLVTGLWLAALAMGLCERALGRGAFPEPRAAVLACLVLGMLWVPFLVDDHDPREGPSGSRWLDWGLAAGAFATWIVLGLVARVLAPERRVRTVTIALGLLASGALAPLVSVLSTEAYVTLNNRDVHALTPFQVELSVLGLVALGLGLLVARARRSASGFSLERLLARRAFPLLVLGLVVYLLYRPCIEFNEDLFEPANSGLMLQQLWDFGRLPFIETFDAHGLSDSIMGLVWRVLQGTRDETWVQWYGWSTDCSRS
jgi:hypothetical protein